MPIKIKLINLLYIVSYILLLLFIINILDRKYLYILQEIKSNNIVTLKLDQKELSKAKDLLSYYGVEHIESNNNEKSKKIKEYNFKDINKLLFKSIYNQKKIVITNKSHANPFSFINEVSYFKNILSSIIFLFFLMAIRKYKFFLRLWFFQFFLILLITFIFFQNLNIYIPIGPYLFVLFMMILKEKYPLKSPLIFLSR